MNIFIAKRIKREISSRAVEKVLCVPLSAYLSAYLSALRACLPADRFNFKSMKHIGSKSASLTQRQKQHLDDFFNSPRKTRFFASLRNSYFNLTVMKYSSDFVVFKMQHSHDPIVIMMN